MCPMPPRVLIVDPQPFFCEALAAALEDGGRVEVVAWTGDEREAEQMTSDLSPDVVLTELRLAPGSGFGVIRRVRERARVVVLTRRDEGDVLLEVAAAGSAGCLGHDLGVDDLPPLVEQALSGRFVVNPDRLGDALRRARKVAAPQEIGRPELAGLTSRERDVLDLLARGLDNVAIARKLHLSAHTVRTHVGNILRKLGVHSRAEAARMALHAGAGEPSVRVLRIEGPTLDLG